MQPGSSKHGPHLDEELKRVEEWRQPQPADEEPPADTALVGGTPPGLSPEEVEARSELARYLAPSLFPAVGQVLLEAAARHAAPEAVLQRLRGLPTGREYDNVAHVWRTLGGGAELRT